MQLKRKSESAGYVDQFGASHENAFIRALKTSNDHRGKSLKIDIGLFTNKDASEKKENLPLAIRTIVFSENPTTVKNYQVPSYSEVFKNIVSREKIELTDDGVLWVLGFPSPFDNNLPFGENWEIA